MQVAVLGGGSGAYAAAADLALGGHAVRLWRRAAPDLAAIRRDGLAITGASGATVARPAIVTADIGEAVRGAEVVVVALAATAHEELARLLRPHLDGGQVVLLTPGFFGAYVLAREIARQGGRLPQAIAETATLPCIAVKTGPAAVTVTARAARMPTGVFPASRTVAVLATLGGLYGSLRPAVDVLDAALANAGPVFHPPAVLLGGGERLASAPSARRLADAVDAERVAARAGLDYPPPHYEGASYYDGLVGADAFTAATGATAPGLDHRYVTEDAALGLALLESAARTAGVESPATTGLLLLFGVLTGRPLSGRGRALDYVGLGDLLRREIRALLADGWASPLWTRVIR